MEVSIVVPAYNEEDVLEDLARSLQSVMQRIGTSFEVVFVNDGSSDGTERVLDEIALKFDFVRRVHLSRNFGKEAAMSAGLDAARGDCVIIIDADLQHPPEVIPSMYERWKQGYDIVNARKRQRGNESLTYKVLAGGFNRIMSSSIGVDCEGASDFKLIDRQVVEVLKSFPERNRFFRGLVSWVGFRVAEVPFDVQERAGGTTKWSLRSLIKYSVGNIVSFSSWPLVFVAYAGFAVIALGLILLAQTLFNYVTGRAVSGFTTVIVVQILLSGMILFAIGIISIYLAKMYDEQKSRPLFVVRKDKARRDAE